MSLDSISLMRTMALLGSIVVALASSSCQVLVGIEDTTVVQPDAAVTPDALGSETLKIVSTFPGQGQEKVPRDIEIRVGFDGSFSADDDLNGLVTLRDDSGMEVASSLERSSLELVLKPERRLEPLSAYTVTVSKEVSSSSGASLLADHVWTFITEERRWSWSKEIVLTESSSGYELALAETGEAIVAWDDSGSIVARHYDPATGWHDAVLVTQAALDFQMKGDASGNVLLAWVKPGSDEVYAKWYRAGSGWGPAELVGGEHWKELTVATDGRGGGVVVWQHRLLDEDGWPYATIAFNRYEYGSGWGEPVLSPGSNPEKGLALDGSVVTENGTVVAIYEYSWDDRVSWSGYWYGSDGSGGEMDIGCCPAQRLFASHGTRLHFFWQEIKEGSGGVYISVRSWDEQGGWSSSTRLVDPDSTVEPGLQDIHPAPGGGAWLVWVVDDRAGSGQDMLQIKRHDGRSWDENGSLNIIVPDMKTTARLGVAEDGEMVLVHAAAGELYSRHYRGDRGWRDLGMLTGLVDGFSAATDLEGNTLLVYRRDQRLFTRWLN